MANNVAMIGIIINKNEEPFIVLIAANHVSCKAKLCDFRFVTGILCDGKHSLKEFNLIYVYLFVIWIFRVFSP